MTNITYFFPKKGENYIHLVRLVRRLCLAPLVPPEQRPPPACGTGRGAPAPDPASRSSTPVLDLPVGHLYDGVVLCWERGWSAAHVDVALLR